jgi:hypothetical protein
MTTATSGVDRFLLLLAAHGLPAPQVEYRFHPERRWRCDYGWPTQRLLVERDGGIYQGGRRPGTRVAGHSSISGIRRDMEKSNAAQLLGFVFLRFTVQQLDSGEALPLIRIALARHDTGERS